MVTELRQGYILAGSIIAVKIIFRGIRVGIYTTVFLLRGCKLGVILQDKVYEYV